MGYFVRNDLLSHVARTIIIDLKSFVSRYVDYN